MKKFLILFSFFVFGTVFAFGEIQWYRTTAYASATVYNGRYSWGDWEKSGLNICFDTDNDIITIYSPRKQVYAVVEYLGTSNDSDGGRQVKFRVIDQDYDKGTIRLRVESNGNSQIYVDFANVAWCYNVYRTQ